MLWVSTASAQPGSASEADGFEPPDRNRPFGTTQSGEAAFANCHIVAYVFVVTTCAGLLTDLIL